MRLELLMLAMFAVWPFSSSKDYHMVADQSVPAASGTVHAERDKDNGNTKIEIKVNHLARPSNLNPSATTYLVWIRPSGGDAVKQGAIGIDKNLKGEMHTVTVAKNFEIFITSEQSDSVTVPSAVEVLQTHVSMD